MDYILLLKSENKNSLVLNLKNNAEICWHRNINSNQIISWNSSNLENIIRIKANILEILAILVNGFGQSNIANYSNITAIKTVSQNVYYDDIHFIEPILCELAEKSCNEKFQ